jgi:uncharacterized protein (TIGR02246 family)
MFGRYAIVLAVAMLLVVGVCASVLAQEDAAAIAREVSDQYTLACRSGDVDLYMSLWDDNGVQMPPDVPANIGKEQIRSGMEAAFDLFYFEVPIFVEEAEIAGDWLFVRCTYSISLTPKEGGETSTRSGKDLSIWKRQADGSWKLYIDCYNYNAPLSAGKLASTSWEPGRAKRAQEDAAEAMVKALIETYTLACNTGDVELFMSLWDDNGVQMAPDAPANIGKEQIRSGMEAFFGAFDCVLPIFLEDAVIAGDWAFGRCRYTESLTPKEGGNTSTWAGKALSIYQRQADGSWKLRIDCFSFDGPPTVTTSVEATSWGQVKSQSE